jgi:RNA polymerase sigma-70 factor (ECF subfamily)
MTNKFSVSIKLDDIIKECKKENPAAQKQLYNHYSPLFLAICLRYMKNREEAEDVLVDSFYQIFTKIDSYKGEGSFEGWMKRILVNKALMELRKNNVLNLSVELNSIKEPSESEEIIESLNYNDLLEMMNELPPGYKTVFNLYVLEGYKHREIADFLGISINTSKSQLILAKKKMREIYKKKQLIKNVKS